MVPSRVTPLLGLLWFAPALAGQASPYLPLDDPRLPLVEHLIAAGDVEDPSPNVRPFRQADLLVMLNAALAHRVARDTGLIAELSRSFAEDTGETWWRVAGRAGGQGVTEARRDPLHPGGPGGVQPYVELGLAARFENLLLVSRPALEPRLVDDPDWPGRKNLEVTGRHLEGYLAAQFRFVRLIYGQLDQNWGPVGAPGIPLSDYGYPLPHLGLEIGTARFRLTAQASTLADLADTAGRTVHRYFFAHRIDARLSRQLQIGLWETVVLGGPERSFDSRYRNPVTLLLLANEYGLGDDGNILMGVDLRWHPSRRLTLLAQLALDDIQYQNRSGPGSYPDRYALTLAATGPLTRSIAWRALYTRATSLAFRTTNPYESFTDQGVGLGRSFADNDQATLRFTRPARRRWLASGELTLLRQGEGALNQPFPNETQVDSIPTIFIGTTERTWRAAVGLTGSEGPLTLAGNIGVHFVDNADHVAGRSRTELAARLQLTLGFARSGTFSHEP